MKKLKIKINDLRLAPKCTPDGSYMKVILFMLIVTNFMVAETWATVALGQYISSKYCWCKEHQFGEVRHLHLAVAILHFESHVMFEVW